MSRPTIRIDTSSLEKHADRLKQIKSEAYPRAVRYTLTELAARTTKESAAQIKERFTLRARNDFTLKSLKTRGALGVRIERMYSTSGTVSPYLGKQEEGGSKTKAVLPTTVASNEGVNVSPRRKLWMGGLDIKSWDLGTKLTPKNPSTAKERAQKLIVRVKTRLTARVMWTSSKGKTYAYRVQGGKRRVHRKKGQSDITSFRLLALHRVNREKVKWEANPWQKSAWEQVMKDFEAIALGAIADALRHTK